jgi:Fe-S cluster biogenesis protein NfuA
MLTAEEFTERMEHVARLVASLATRADDPVSRDAASLLGIMSELYAAGLQRMLALINAGGDAYRPLQERFAQDDLIRSMLLLHDMHPIDLKTRLAEAVDNLRPVVESYGGRVSIVGVSRDQVTLRLQISDSAGPSPVKMIKDLLEQAILVVAPDAGTVRYDDRKDSEINEWSLPIVQIR